LKKTETEEQKEQITMQSWTPPAFEEHELPDQHTPIRREKARNVMTNLEYIERADNKQNKHPKGLLGNNSPHREQLQHSTKTINIKEQEWLKGGYNIIPSRLRSAGRPMYALNKPKSRTHNGNEEDNKKGIENPRNKLKQTFERKGDG
jgi:hypothetical protein